MKKGIIRTEKPPPVTEGPVYRSTSILNVWKYVGGIYNAGVY